jgi:bifunctional non-homologous end joining protein LigD
MPSGARSGFGALLLGYWEGGELVYAGKVGTGFTERVLADLHGALLRLERASSPFGSKVAERKAHWVEPELVAEVAFTGWTPDLRLRHPSFLGLRPDRASREVVREERGQGTSAPEELSAEE